MQILALTRFHTSQVKLWLEVLIEVQRWAPVFLERGAAKRKGEANT